MLHLQGFKLPVRLSYVNPQLQGIWALI